MDWTSIKGVVEEMIDEKLSGLQEAFHAQNLYLEELIQKLEASKKDEKSTDPAIKPKPKPHIEDHSSPENPGRPKTAPNPKKDEELKEEAKKKAEQKAQKDLEVKKHQEELKKKKQEELEKKKEQEEKKKEALAKAKEEENKKKEEAKKKKADEDAKKKEELKAKQAQEAEKKRKELEEKNKQAEEKKKKKEEEKKEIKKKEDKKEEKKKPSPIKKKEVAKKVEEDKKEEEKKEEPIVEVKLDEPSYSTLSEIQDALKQLTEANPEIPDPPSFSLSSKSKEALKVLNIIEEERFYLTQPAPIDTIVIFRLFFQLLGQSLPENNEEAWAICQTFLSDLRNKDAHEGKTISELIEEKASTFDFSFENIEKCELLSKGHHAKINPNYHKDTCALAGFMAFIVRDGLVYAGIVKGEGASKLYSYLLFKQNKLTESS